MIPSYVSWTRSGKQPGISDIVPFRKCHKFKKIHLTNQSVTEYDVTHI